MYYIGWLLCLACSPIQLLYCLHRKQRRAIQEQQQWKFSEKFNYFVAVALSSPRSAERNSHRALAMWTEEHRRGVELSVYPLIKIQTQINQANNIYTQQSSRISKHYGHPYFKILNQHKKEQISFTFYYFIFFFSLGNWKSYQIKIINDCYGQAARWRWKFSVGLDSDFWVLESHFRDMSIWDVTEDLVDRSVWLLLRRDSFEDYLLMAASSHSL